MAEFFHGVRKGEKGTALTAPVTAASGTPFVVGTAPAHLVGGKANELAIAFSFEEAAAQLGYSDEYGKYTLCEVMHSHFRMFGMAPVIFVNVLDAASMKSDVPATDLPVEGGRVKLPFEAIPETVEVKDAGGAGAAYVRGGDYEVLADKGHVAVEIIKGGAIPAGAANLSVAYSKVEPSDVTKDDVVGGYNVSTGETTGLELIKHAFAKFGRAPDLILAPGFSHEPEVAAAMAAKAARIGGLFTGKALIDAPAGANAARYADVPAWKTANAVAAKEQVVFWPRARLGGSVFHLSTLAAGLMASVDAKNGCPAESPSNKPLKAGGLCLDDGREVVLSHDEANFLNANGVATGLNFSGLKLWGNCTAAYPASSDVKDYFIPVSRMFDFIGNSVILSTWGKVDDPTNRRLVESMTDSFNIWLNGLTAEGKLLGGRVEFNEAENPSTDLIAGIIRYHIHMTPPSPMQEVDFMLEYDAGYMSALFA